MLLEKALEEVSNRLDSALTLEFGTAESEHLVAAEAELTIGFDHLGVPGRVRAASIRVVLGAVDFKYHPVPVIEEQ